MAREERAERPPDPSREHPIAKAVSGFQRGTWNVVYGTCVKMNLQGEARAQIKAGAVAELNGIIAQLNAL